MRAALAVLALALLASGAAAHKPSDAYLTLERNDAQIGGRWDIALRDLDTAVGLDTDGDGSITWGELRSRQAVVASYALSRLRLRSGGEDCALEAPDLQVDEHTDGTYAVLMLRGACSAAGPVLTIDYRLLFDLDPQHRGLLHYVERGASRSLVLSADEPRQEVASGSASAPAQLAAYVHEGVWHIWLGFDHVLFLLCLLLPAVWRSVGARWWPQSSLRNAIVDVAKVVTAFTLAHSITLSLAVLGVVQLPSRWVESAIALSVVLAAANNLRPVVRGSRWAVAFAFGLLHGFGFAGALQDLGLPRGSLALSLFGFNVGVELGQLAIVALLLPAAYAARRTAFYRRVVCVGGSALVVVVGSAWLVERALDVPVFAPMAAVARAHALPLPWM